MDLEHVLRIAHCPLHGPSATRREAARALWRLEACSVGYSEAYRLIPYLRRRPRWRIAVGAAPGQLRGPGDVPVLVRRHHKPIERWAFQACERAVPIELAPPRWITGFAYRHPLGPILHVNHHPNPVNAPKATLPLRREYRQSMERLEATLREVLKQRRQLPVVTGDFNLSRRSTLEYGPRKVFDRLGLRHWSVGVDWIAWHPSLVATDRRELDGAQDHPWLTVDFEGFRGRP